MIAALTGTGLSAAAGLNAYIPFLIVALIAKYTDLVVLPASYGWMESWWAIGIGTVLLLTEVVLDKVPAVDTVNDAVQTFIRPSMGGLLGAATAGAARLDGSPWMATRFPREETRTPSPCSSRASCRSWSPNSSGNSALSSNCKVTALPGGAVSDRAAKVFKRSASPTQGLQTENWVSRARSP